MVPPRSPLPARHGLSAAWVRTPDRDALHSETWPTMASWLRHKLPEQVDVAGFLADGRFVYDDGRPVLGDDPYLPHTFVWFHRDLRDEVTVPGSLTVVHRDERIIVVDKPPFLSTIPRGQHVQQSVVVRLRDELGLPELSPLHRLDRVTSGLLLLATERRWRGPYQVMFEHGTVRKTYRALAPWRSDLAFPVTVRNHIQKTRGAWQAEVVPDAPVNAETLVEVEAILGDIAVYRLTPRTGRTHQLRLHLHGLGIPIVGDPLYPVVRETAIDDFSRPLQLLASELAFTDPVDASSRTFVSARGLPLLPEGA
jgi:tRNA pseudouridine32 synthase/23S rRNA pseudouridine746 synthase